MNNSKVSLSAIGLGVLLVTGGLIGSVVFGSWFTIDQGERGVVLRNGAITETAEPGLHFKLPFFESVVRVSTQSRKVSYNKMQAYSSDQQPADLNISVNYHIEPAGVQDVYSTYGSELGMIERLVSPHVLQETKVVFGGFTAVKAIQNRGELNKKVYDAIVGAVKGPVIIESIQLENIDFSDAYEQSVEQRMLAEVEVQKVRQNSDREKVQADIVRTKAQAEADAKVAQAEADAKAIRARGEAEAYALEARGKAEAAAIAAKGTAMRDNPTMVSLISAEKWNGKLPLQMVPGSAVPFVSLSSKNQ